MLRKSHIALYLTHDYIAGASLFQLYNEQLPFVFADSQYVDRTSIGGILLTNYLSIYFIDVVPGS